MFINDVWSITPFRGDATHDDEPGCRLFRDLMMALVDCSRAEKPVALFANVNRGILLEEASCLGELVTFHFQHHQGGSASEIIRWLALPPSSLSLASCNSSRNPSGGDLKLVVAIDPHQLPYTASIPEYTLFSSGSARAAGGYNVDFLDVALAPLEPKPNVNQRVVDFSQQVPAVAPYHTIGNLVSIEVPRDATTAGKLVH